MGMAVLLLLLLCCCRVTGQTGATESDVTGETQSTSANSLVPTTSAQNTLHPNLNKTNTFADFDLTQSLDITTMFTGLYDTEFVPYVNSYEEGRSDVANFKETDTVRGFIEREHEELNLLNRQIDSLYNETERTAWNYIEGNDESVRQLALNKTVRYAQALMEYVNRSKELNRFLDEQNSTAGYELRIKNVREYEDEVTGVLNIKRQMDHLFTLISINVKFKELTGSVRKKAKAYGEGLDISLLEENENDLEKIIQLLKEHLREAKTLLNVTNVFNMKLAFSCEYTENLVDLETWESELQNRSLDLTGYRKLLQEERFRLLLKNYVNPVLQSVIFIVGLLGNGVLLVVFARHRDMRTPPNLMVLNLTFGDFLSLISNILVYGAVDVAGAWRYGQPLCTIYRFVRHLCLGVSVYSLVVISVQRFLALTDLFGWHGCGCRLTKLHKSLLAVASVWLLAGAIALPRTLTAGVYNNRCLGSGADASEDYYRLVNSIDVALLCILPLAIITVLSGATAIRIRASIKGMPGESAGNQKIKEARVLSSTILVALIVVFAICYVPYFLYIFLNAWFTLDVDNSTHQLISFLTFSLIFANACFNPIAVYLVSRKYREYMKKYLLCKHRELVDQDGGKTSTTTTDTVETKM